MFPAPRRPRRPAQSHQARPRVINLRLRLHLLLTILLLITVACSTTTPDRSAEPPVLATDAVTADAGEDLPGSGEAAPDSPPETDADEPDVSSVPEESLQSEPAEEDTEPEPDVMQREALELCQSAAEFLDQGDMVDAIAALDRAYDLMLELPNSGDTTYLQAKEDIRRLVADLIVRTYSSERSTAQPTTMAWELDIPIETNEHVQREIKSFTTTERDVFLQSYRRSGLYREMILEKLEEAGLPRQLSWLPLVESNFKVRALSRASALGLWQFIASTGQRYGLSRDGWIDERMDPEKSTDAAIAYLIELHAMFGDWPKALAGYNCGESRVMRLTNRRQGEYVDFWDLYAQLPRETRRYVPRFIATLVILEDPAAYGMTLPEPLPPIEWTAVPINRPVQLKQLDAALGLTEGTLHGLNPELRHRATPKRTYDLKVPTATSGRIAEAVAGLAEWSPPQAQYVTHRVRRGETLSGIASRYRTSVRSIMRTNRIRSANRIWPGQRLKIPVRGGGSSSSPGPGFNAAEGTHTVQRGESLYSIARRYRTTVARLKADNGLSSDVILPGQKLKVRPGSRTDLRRYTVRRGDTLSAIADAHRVNLSALMRVNGLSRRSTIYPGQVLVLPD